MPLVYTLLYFDFPLPSCCWKTGACEYSSALLQQRAGAERLQPEQLSCLHVELQCLWDGLPGRYLNLESGVGKFHESRGEKNGGVAGMW